MISYNNSCKINHTFLFLNPFEYTLYLELRRICKEYPTIFLNEDYPIRTIINILHLIMFYFLSENQLLSQLEQIKYRFLKVKFSSFLDLSCI